jgi:hypothetical protein
MKKEKGTKSKGVVVPVAEADLFERGVVVFSKCPEKVGESIKVIFFENEYFCEKLGDERIGNFRICSLGGICRVSRLVRTLDQIGVRKN